MFWKQKERNVRKRGLDNLLGEFSNASIDPTKLTNLFENFMLKNIIRALSDKIERHRSTALSIINKYVLIAESIPLSVSESLLATLVKRISQAPFPEGSEEMRISIIKCLQAYLQKAPDHFKSGFLPFTEMLLRCLHDSSPEIKRETSTLIQIASKLIPSFIGEHSKSILNSLNPNCTHQHFRIRSYTIETMTAVLLTPKAGSNFSTSYPFLRSLSNDKNPEVRKTCYKSACSMLKGFSLSNLEESETFLVLILMNGLPDEKNEEVVQELLEESGKSRKELEDEINAGLNKKEETSPN